MFNPKLVIGIHLDACMKKIMMAAFETRNCNSPSLPQYRTVAPAVQTSDFWQGKKHRLAACHEQLFYLVDRVQKPSSHWSVPDYKPAKAQLVTCFVYAARYQTANAILQSEQGFSNCSRSGMDAIYEWAIRLL
jgi:hypothetical protein